MSVREQKWAGLMAKAQRGDSESYRALLLDLCPVLERIVRRKVFDANAAEDVFQDVLLTLHKGRATWDPRRAFEPWFYSIVRNKIFDHLRKVKRLKAWEAVSLDVAEPQSAAEDTLSEESELLQKALTQLPEAQRMAVQLVKIEGLSMQEAADRLEISVSAMKVRAHRGYESLKKVLQDEDANL